MSVHVSSYVWKHSRQKGAALLLMLAIAEQANDDGVCWPGVESLAERARCSERNVQLLIRKLEEAGEIEVSYGTGRKHTNVYGVKGYRDELRGKGENIAPLMHPAKGERVKSCAQKGEIQRQERVKPVSPEPKEEPSIEPSVVGTATVEALPDDTTSACLLLLKRVKGFPRNQAENAIYLGELRAEFPGVDARQVCRQYELWHRDNPGKTKNYRNRLRNFFESAAKNGRHLQAVAGDRPSRPGGGLRELR